MTAAFDTLRLARNLREKAKLTPEQAEGFADAMAEAVQSDIATKIDIRDLRSELRETELRLEAKIEASKAEIIKWLSGTHRFSDVRRPWHRARTHAHQRPIMITATG